LRRPRRGKAKNQKPSRLPLVAQNRQPEVITRKSYEFVGRLCQTIGDFGFRDLRLAESLQDFSQWRLGDPFRRSGRSHQQKIADIRRDLNRESGPILEFRNGVVCVERLLPRVEQSELIGVALDILWQNGDVISAQIDETRLVQPRALLVFGLRIGDSHSGRQTAVFVRDDDDEEVAFANLLKADVDRPPGLGAEEFHRIVPLLDAANGVEYRLALLLDERAADEHVERRGHQVSQRPNERD
jgi:hypothetical protein